MKYYAVVLLGIVALSSAFPAFAEDGTKERPPFYQNAIERAEFRKEQLEARDALFKDQWGERHDLLGERKEDMRALWASSTPEERKAFLDEHKEERQALFLENKEERHDFFVENRGERRDLIKEQWEEKKEWLASTSLIFKATWSEEKKDKVLDRAEHFATLFGKMLERLSGIADRIEGRIAELEADGVDVSESSDLLDTADEKIADAADAIDEAVEAMKDALDAEDPTDHIEAIKTAKESVKTALRAAHEALKEAAASLPKPEEE